MLENLSQWVFLGRNIRNFLGKNFKGWGRKAQDFIFRNIRKAFVWENIRKAFFEKIQEKLLVFVNIRARKSHLKYQQKLYKMRKLWYLLLCKFRPLLPKNNF